VKLSDYIAEKKGANMINAIVMAIATLAFGMILLGFLFLVGDALIPAGAFNTTYQQLKTTSPLIVFACVIIPLAMLMGAFTYWLGG
jgi:hypothetical protein